MIDDRFRWSDRKAAANLKKHGVSFEQARGVFDDPFEITLKDLDHSRDEQRYTAIGVPPGSDALLVVVYVFRGSRIRIINARRATPAEKRRYMHKHRNDIDRISDSDYDPADNYEVPDEVDFSRGIRGLVYIPGTVALRLDRDVASHFHNARQVNDALRQLISEGRVPQPTS